MHSKNEVVPDQRWYRDLAPMDFWFLAILGGIAVGIVVGIIIRR